LTDAAVAVHFDGVPDQAPLPVKIALFRSLQEALSNATRHARGAPVAARVGADAGFLHLTVTDQGPGFAVERVGAAGRLGLAGLREQAELLGGSFQIDTSPGRGTTLRLHWPLVRSEDAWPT
jgi:signal transduction histidine kinase